MLPYVTGGREEQLLLKSRLRRTKSRGNTTLRGLSADGLLHGFQWGYKARATKSGSTESNTDVLPAQGRPQSSDSNEKNIFDND
jgi:hypothetical protein